MSLMNLLTDAKIVKVDNGHVAGTSLVTSSTIDASGFDAALVIADFGTVTDACVLTLNAQDGALSNGSDAATIASTLAFTAASSSNGQIVLDCILAQKRYLTVTLTRTTQNAVVNSITVILYRAHSKPTTQPSTVLASAVVEAAA